MPIGFQQQGGNRSDRRNRRCKVTLTDPTVELNHVIVVAVVINEQYEDPRITGPEGFQLIMQRTARHVTLAMWYRESCPSLSTIEVYARNSRSIQVKVLEAFGLAQSNSLDQTAVKTGVQNNYCSSGVTNITVRPDELVLGVIASHHWSTRHYGFLGSLSWLFEHISHDYDPDDCGSRLTIHGKVTTQTGKFYIDGRLTVGRDWVAMLVSFKGGTIGPARFTSIGQAITCGGDSTFTAFGPLKSTLTAPITVNGSGRIGPYDYQYRLGGFTGKLIGSGTKFHVEGTEGLYGWQVRTSDEDLPREDGALRGVDLASARQVLFKLNVGRGKEEVEANMQELYKALAVRRDEDFELLWRRPGQPLKIMRCRPIELLRDNNATQLMFSKQSFLLRAADPRHYGAVEKTIQIPISASESTPIYESVVNEGNSEAYPLIQIKGPSSGPPVTRVNLVNVNGLYTFDVRLQIPSGALLQGDMEAAVTSVGRSIVTLDGQTKYGAWQLPRETFKLEPDPVLEGGENVLYCTTEPANAPVQVTLSYRDTWDG